MKRKQVSKVAVEVVQPAPPPTLEERVTEYLRDVARELSMARYTWLKASAMYVADCELLSTRMGVDIAERRPMRRYDAVDPSRVVEAEAAFKVAQQAFNFAVCSLATTEQHAVAGALGRAFAFRG